MTLIQITQLSQGASIALALGLLVTSVSFVTWLVLK